MDWLDSMNAALDYIEEHLDEKIDMAAAAHIACCSEYHFTRMFSFIINLPLNEYIRRRRLSLAGFELKNSNIKIIDLAMKYGYDSQGAFARAFQIMHGVRPSEARIPGVPLQSVSRISFTIAIKGGEKMEYRIVEENAWTAFGKSMVTKMIDANENVLAYWSAGEVERMEIIHAVHGDEKTLVRSLLFDENEETLRYARCLEMPVGGVSGNFECYEVPARRWAVFPKIIEPESGDGIISVWQRIWTEWFPESGYEQDTGPRQERCLWQENGKMIVEAWVPVIQISR